MQSQQQHRGKTNKDIFLDDLTCPRIDDEIKKEIESITNLLCLSLNNCKLESLENFPNLPSLIRLEIMDNLFPAEDLKYLTGLTSLQSLSLANTKISDFTQLEPLKSIPNLVQLDLSECEIADKEGYRKSVFGMLEKLHILDNLDEEGKPFEYSGESEVEEDDGNDDDEEGEDFEADENEEIDEPELNGDAQSAEESEVKKDVESKVE
jgi:hypothetical protein